MEFVGKCMLRPGPTADRPVTLSVVAPQRDEDGSMASVELDLTVAEANMLAQDLRQATKWVNEGAWKPGRP
jgi:hypothetical protein